MAANITNAKSDTPRTDAFRGSWNYGMREFAQDLERENNKLREQNAAVALRLRSLRVAIKSVR